VTERRLEALEGLRVVKNIATFVAACGTADLVQQVLDQSVIAVSERAARHSDSVCCERDLGHSEAEACIRVQY
jgi:hypothetical protein